MKISSISLMGSPTISLWNWHVSRNCLLARAVRVFSYGTQDIDPRQVGQELGVKHILEGQVRRLGNQVRISVRLISVQSGEHLWAERFDRPFDDLFEILDELVSRIIGTIVGRVEAADMAEARRKRPEDMNGLRLPSSGKRVPSTGRRDPRQPARKAVKWFERAIAADPNYGLSYAWRVCAASWLPDFRFPRKHEIPFRRQSNSTKTKPKPIA